LKKFRFFKIFNLVLKLGQTTLFFGQVFIDLNSIGNSSNQQKKTQNKQEITLNIQSKLHQKLMKKNTFLALNNSKIKIFSKFKNQMMI
jgi:hypothetical protein